MKKASFLNNILLSYSYMFLTQNLVHRRHTQDVCWISCLLLILCPKMTLSSLLVSFKEIKKTSWLLLPTWTRSYPFHCDILPQILTIFYHCVPWIPTFFYYSFIHMCLHCLGHFSLLPPSPPSPPASRQNQFCAFLLFHWRVEINNNKKDIAFLLVEKRTAIQRDS
jgi:hypothetical protein